MKYQRLIDGVSDGAQTLDVVNPATGPLIDRSGQLSQRDGVLRWSPRIPRLAQNSDRARRTL